jgi:hypothetical protein
MYDVVTMWSRCGGESQLFSECGNHRSMTVMSSVGEQEGDDACQYRKHFQKLTGQLGFLSFNSAITTKSENFD